MPASTGSYWRTNSIQLPVLQSGTYYLIFTTDLYNNLLESNTGNNKLTVPITLNITPPDLAPIAFQAPSAVTAPPHPQVTFVWGVTNQGTGAALGYWIDNLAISTNSVLIRQPSRRRHYEYGPVAPGTAYWRTNTYNVPVTHSGTFYFFFQANSGGALYESDEANNVAVAQVTFDIHPADLVPAAFLAPNVVSGLPDQTALLLGGYERGQRRAIGQWTDQVYLSASSNLD